MFGEIRNAVEIRCHPEGTVRGNLMSRGGLYGQLSPSFICSSDVRQGCPISHHSFIFVVGHIFCSPMNEQEDIGVELLPIDRLNKFEDADTVVLGDSIEAV